MSSMRSGGVRDRYTVPSESNRRGAHRARPNPVSGSLPVVAVAVVVIAVMAGAFVLIGSGLFASRANSTDSSRLPGFSPLPAATAVPPNLPVQVTGAAPAPPAAAANRKAFQSAVKLTVLNSTTTAGLAKRAAAVLQAKGWQVLKTGNFNGKGVNCAPPGGEGGDEGGGPEDCVITQTTVFFAAPAQAGVANEVATDLGLLHIQQSALAALGMTVVLGPDYHP